MAKVVYYQCPECGLHYSDQTIAQSCEKWCRERQSCSLEITQLSLERQSLKWEGGQGDEQTPPHSSDSE